MQFVFISVISLSKLGLSVLGKAVPWCGIAQWVVGLQKGFGQWGCQRRARLCCAEVHSSS